MNPFTLRLCSSVVMADLATVLAMLALEVRSAEHPGLTKAREWLRPQAKIREDGIAIAPIQGFLAPKPDPFEMAYYGVEDSGSLVAMLAGLRANPNVRGVLLDLDTPGGVVTGGVEIADEVAKLRAKMPVVAWCGGVCASLGYYIAANASEIVTSRSAMVGSIGSVISWLDYGKAMEMAGVSARVFTNAEATLKTAGAQGVPLSDEQKAYIQARVDAAGKDFHRAIKAAGRELPDEAKTGRVYFGWEAKKSGLIDRVGDQSFALAVLRSAIRAG